MASDAGARSVRALTAGLITSHMFQDYSLPPEAVEIMFDDEGAVTGGVQLKLPTQEGQYLVTISIDVEVVR